jgi:hypothetical protein
MVPISPIVNYNNAPSYYITKITADCLKRNLELPFEYNIKNSITLDITNLYTNIPIHETIELITTKLKDNTNFDDHSK